MFAGVSAGTIHGCLTLQARNKYFNDSGPAGRNVSEQGHSDALHLDSGTIPLSSTARELLTLVTLAMPAFV
jgi:hypothetical protein